MRTTRATRLAFVLLAFMPSVAGATPILDQFQDDAGLASDGGGGISVNEGLIQTITVGVTGRLAKFDFRSSTFIELPGGPPGTRFGIGWALVTFRQLDQAGNPIWSNDGVVAALSYNPPTFDPQQSYEVPWLSIDIDPINAKEVTAGERLAIVFEDGEKSPLGGSAGIAGTSHSAYQGGGLQTGYLLWRQDPIAPEPSRSIFFRTWVEPATVFVPLPGDVDLDGTVGLSDFGILKAHFGQAGARADGDLTGDGRVDISDFGELKDNYGRTRPGPFIGPTVPEPPTLALAIIGTLAVTLFLRPRGNQ